MKHYLSAGLTGLALLLSAADGELLDNPKFENNAAGWANWGHKQDLVLTSSPEGLQITAVGSGLNQGPAKKVRLKPGYEYEYSCKLKGELGENAHAHLLHWYFPDIKKGGKLRTVRDKFEWWDHKVRFSVPENSTGLTVLRPVLLHGPGNIVIEQVSLRELGKAVSGRRVQENKIPDDTPYDHMEMTGDIEKDSKAKLNEYQRQQKEHMRSYRKRLDGIYDTGYYFCVCFKDSASREAFMREFSPRHAKDRFVDGDKFASGIRSYARKQQK